MASSTLSVRKQTPVLVTPAKPAPFELKQLSDIDDQESLRFHAPIIQYYKNEPLMKGHDPVVIIKEALSKALVSYYPFAGRLREGPGRKLAVECNGEGVLFIEADADVRLEDFGERLPPPLPWLSELLDEVAESDGIVGCPLLLIQVTRLACGGFIFAIRFNHTMCDAQGIAQFLAAVGEIARGASAPSINPVWARELLSVRDPPDITHEHREFDTIPESKRALMFAPNVELVEKSFFFGPNEITALKQQVPFPCTSFEVLAASMWRARAIALRLDPDDEIRFMFNINVRSKMSPMLPTSYYGNVFVYPAIISTVRKLFESPLSYAVELVKEAKAKATCEYIKSTADLLATSGRPPFAMIGAPNVYFVSDNTRAGYAEVDYGWGTAVYGGPAVGGLVALPGVLSFYVAFKNELGEKGTVVPMCLPKDAMDRLSVEIQQLVLVQAM